MLRIAAVINLLAGLLMLGLSVLPFVRGTTNWGMTIGLGVGGLVCLFIGAALFVGAGKAAAQNQLLQTGQPGIAIIKGMKETGISMQHGMYIVIDFTLEITSGTGTPYMAAVRSTVPRLALGSIALNKKLAVKIDPANPSRVAIDWNTPVA